MCKITGLLLMFIASASLGFLKASEFRERKALLEEFRETLLRISTEISYFKEPLPLIFGKLAGVGNGKSALFLRLCLSSYEDKKQDMRGCWKQAMDGVYGPLPLTAEDKSVMSLCGGFLGQSDYENQKKHFALVLDKLDRQIGEADLFIKTKGRMYGKLGVSAGLALAAALI